MNSIAQSGLNIVNHAFRQAAESSHTIASAVVEPTNGEAQVSDQEFTQAIVDLQMSETLNMAGVRVIRTADELVGTLIDTTA